MTFTLHLYETDEVSAAFLWSIRCKDSSSSQFWLDELEASGYTDESRQVLLVAWALFYGLTSCGWLHHWATTGTTRKGRRMLLRTLLACTQTDGSIWWLLLSVCIRTNHPVSLWTRWRSAASLSHEAFWEPIVCASTDERLDAIYTGLQQDLGYSTFLGKAIGFLLSEHHSTQSLPEDVWTQPDLQGPVQWRAKAYDAQSFFGRTEPIPQECLAGLTQRGGTIDTVDHLQKGLVIHLRRSPYWQRFLWPEGSDLKTPDHVEAFWDIHFKDTDIPDEWSLAEQQKSHGYALWSSLTVAEWCAQWISCSESRFLPLSESERSEINSELEIIRLTDYLSIFHFLVHHLYSVVNA